jgi:hypothetical protein
VIGKIPQKKSMKKIVDIQEKTYLLLSILKKGAF